MLPNIPFHSLVVDAAAPNTVYASADVGVYRSTDAGTTWTSFSNQLPNAMAADLVFHQADRLLRVGTRNRGVWEINVDRANMPDVEVYVRDSTVDTGRRSPSPSGADPFAPPAQTYFWESTDIKVDSPPYQVANLGDVDFVFFEDDHGVSAGGLIHENTERNRTVRVYVEVHNRGINPASNVDVKVFFANASLGLPDLPAGFWTNFPNNVLPNNSPWQPIAAHKTVPEIRCGLPAVVGFDWAVPATQAAHSCLLAVISAQNDSLVTTEVNVGNLVLGQRKCALKNLAVVDPVATPIVQLDINWPRRRGRYWIGTDAGGRALKAVILGQRLARYASEKHLKSRKVTASERKQLQLFLRDNRHIKPANLDLVNVYAPPAGPWLLVDAGEADQPDHLVAIFDKPIRDRFAIVQWDEQGFAVGGFTFDPSRRASAPTAKKRLSKRSAEGSSKRTRRRKTK